MKKILTISDGIKNGKGGNDSVTFLYHTFIYNILYVNNEWLINGKAFNFNSVDIIIFNYNEDLFTYNLNWDMNLIKRFKSCNEMINFFKLISFEIQKKYPKIKIYNDPIKCFELGDKVNVYQKIEKIKDELFKVPRWIKVNNLNDANKINFYPNIIKISNGSHSKDDKKCNNKNDLIEHYNKYFLNKNNVFCVEYIDSYQKSLTSFISLRLMVFNNEVIDYYFRPSNNWNIHTNDQNKNLVVESDKFFKTFYDSNKAHIQNYLNEVYKIYGNGFFTYDLIFNNNKLYICEIGLKNYDDSYAYFINNNKIKLNKISLQKDKLKQYYHDML